MKQTILLLFLAGLIIRSVPVQAQQTLKKVYVVNEGNFGQANASITAYNPSDGTVVMNAFYKENGELLGNVAQSSVVIGDRMYTLIYGNSKIFVTDSNTLKLEAAISLDKSNGKGPRQMVAAADGKAYVTNEDSKNVSVIDLSDNEVTKTIPLGSGPEGIGVSNHKAYVALNDLGQGDSVAVIDVESDKVIKKLKVEDNPVDISVDNQGRVWVVCVGNFGYDSQGNYNANLETFGKIVVIDGKDDSIIKTIDVGGHPGDIALMPSMNKAYYNDNGIVSIDMKTLTADGDTLVKGSFYAMDVAHDEQTPQLFVADAADYVSAGSVTRYDLTTKMPTKLAQFSAGIIPGGFQFIYSGSSTPIERTKQEPDEFTLSQNFPNPFNPSTVIRYHLGVSGRVELNIYNITGQLVDRLVSQTQAAGDHLVRFSASRLSSGVYFYRLKAGGKVLVKKMLLMK